jgi:hypothetical protein
MGESIDFWRRGGLTRLIRLMGLVPDQGDTSTGAQWHPSVVGFDDIPGTAFANPGLSTVRQPLIRMGQIAAQIVVDQIEGRGEYVPEIAIEPEFVVRASTSPVTSREEKVELPETRLTF